MSPKLGSPGLSMSRGVAMTYLFGFPTGLQWFATFGRAVRGWPIAFEDGGRRA